ncbi:MAG: NAD(P)-dependent oxidoreductase [Acidobacteriota bacterium]
MSLTLITGAPGWLGNRLVEVLIKGLPDVPKLAQPDPSRRIRCLALPGTDVSPLRALSSNIEIIVGDLRDTTALTEFSRGGEGATLFHCAGVIHPTRGVQEFFEVNVEGTRKLLQTAESVGVARLVAVSSNSPIGTNPSRNHLFDETSPYNPYMGYGRSKMMLEQAVQEYQERGRLQTVIIRPPWFYGPHQPPRQTLFFKMIKNGQAPIVGDGENRRSMAYVDNICQGLLLCERVSAANGQIYWIADRRPYTSNEIVDTVERLLEKEFGIAVAHRRLRLPSITSEIALLADRILQGFGLYHQKIHVLSEMNKDIACSIVKAQKELDYNPVIELEEGMRRSIAWLLEKGHQI